MGEVRRRSFSEALRRCAVEPGSASCNRVLEAGGLRSSEFMARLDSVFDEP